jgi:diphthamide biosynthesis protein 4
MQFDETRQLFQSPCRCGGSYEITEAQLSEQVELVFCNGCTLQVKILYEVQEDE